MGVAGVEGGEEDGHGELCAAGDRTSFYAVSPPAISVAQIRWTNAL
ncbi:hypothetical protein IMCC9480_1415 [Oxalobacteraceae bacterium IMCC9480]|nr:hypothetical protein IMCC9480_1415 [Oxalobacteraceae bacterium IMCC9480]